MKFLHRFFASPDPAVLWPRWIFLRCLGVIFFSAFYSLVFQIRGLIGPRGILPAGPWPFQAPEGLTAFFIGLAPPDRLD